MAASKVSACVLLDLDGTLADTAHDLSAALNALLVEQGRATIAPERLRGEVSRGSRSLLYRGFGVTPQDPAYGPLRERFLALYEACFAATTVLFEGIDEALEAWRAVGVPWGVVTNKPSRFTFPLLEHLRLSPEPVCVVTPDMVMRAKPDPEPVVLACQQAGVSAGRALFVGDARQDIEAGRAAGVTTGVACYGYIPDREAPATWGADYQVQTPADLQGVVAEWLRTRRR